MMKILVTGAAGFIGYHASRALLERGEIVVGLDNLNPYYDPALKLARLQMLKRFPNFAFAELDVADRAAIEAFFSREGFQRVIHLAAQAGVRYSIDHPHVYVESNVAGFLHIIEGCRRNSI
jgi:UDP-glucuronate 4-epimerase